MCGIFFSLFIEECHTGPCEKDGVSRRPRQLGKTTFAEALLEKNNVPMERFLNWDAAEDREQIIREWFPAGAGWVVLDEIHKHTRWQQVVKGLFDKRHPKVSALVTMGWIRQ